jgi:hypothetical protein
MLGQSSRLIQGDKSQFVNKGCHSPCSTLRIHDPLAFLPIDCAFLYFIRPFSKKHIFHKRLFYLYLQRNFSSTRTWHLDCLLKLL